MPEYLDRSSKNAKGYLPPRSISEDQALGSKIRGPNMVENKLQGKTKEGLE
jgi:hypothetical protein